MTSFTRGAVTKIANETKNDDDINHRSNASISSAVVEPCCRFPRESVPQFAASTPEATALAKESSKRSSTPLSSTTKVENYYLPTSPVLGEESVVTKEGEDSARITENEPRDRSEMLIGGVGGDVTTFDGSMTLTPPVASMKIAGFPMVDKSSANVCNPSNVAVPRSGSSRRAPPDFDERPLILATHLVPSLPMALFEILAEVIEAATDRAVSLLYEPRVDRPVAKDIVDIAILPASDCWIDGTLLPVSFVFEHPLNKEKKPSVFVDIVVASDCMRNVEEVTDLRGYRCASPDRRKAVGAAGLLFGHLKSKGENPSFFGNILDSGSQVSALRMVAGKQAEVGVVESPVINYHKNTLPGADALHILASLGPLPPYRIMLNKKLNASICAKIKESLLTIESDETWMERLRPFGVVAFAEYSADLYDLEDMKTVATSVPYY